MWIKRKKKTLEDVEEDKKFEDMSYEEIQEGLELLRLVAEFGEKYGEMPELKQFGPFILGWRKVKRWKHDFNIFREGVNSDSKWAMKGIKDSGWLKDGVPEELEREEKEEETGS